MRRLSRIAEKIRRLMERRGVSYRRLAQETGLAQKTIYLALTEPEDRTVKTLHKIAKVLDVPLYTLFVPADLPDWVSEEETEGETVKVTIEIPKSAYEHLRLLAQELEQDPEEFINMWFRSVAVLHRYLCPECDGAFAANASARYCPYCGADFEKTTDEPIAQ